MKVTKPSPDLQEQIRRRAHELYEQRGKDDGHELDDWLASGVGTQSAEGEGCHRIESHWGRSEAAPDSTGSRGAVVNSPNGSAQLNAPPSSKMLLPTINTNARILSDNGHS